MLLSIARLFALVGVYFKVPHLLTGAHQHVLCSFTCSIPAGNELKELIQMWDTVVILVSYWKTEGRNGLLANLALIGA